MHLLSSNKFAGAEHIAADIIQHFMSLDKNIEIVYVSPMGEIEQSLQMRNIPYVPLKSFSFFEVYKAVRAFAPDIIHAHDYKASCLAAILPSNARIVSHIHHNNVCARRLSLLNILFILTSWRFERIVVVSSAVIDEFCGGQFFRDKTSVIHNVICENEILEKSNELAMLQDDDKQIDFLFVGRMEEPKNPLRFIELMKALHDKKIKFHAAMIGDGELFDDVKRAVENYRLNDCVDMKGFLDNPYPYMKKAKTLIVTSKWEGFGLVAVEAMLLGCRVLVTPVGGLPDLVRGYDENWVCNNDEAFLQQMDMLPVSECTTIRKYAEQINDEKTFSEKWEKLYFNS